MSTKITQVGAFKLESPTSAGWGQTNSVQDLGNNDAIPYTSMTKNKTMNFETDNSIVSEAFKDVPRLVGVYPEDSIKMYNRFYGINKLLYWAFGFENSVKSVVVFTPANAGQSITPGSVWLDDSLNEYTFLRKEVNRITTFFVFSSLNTPAQLGTLTSEGVNFEYTANSGLMYEHLFEIDSHNRELKDYLPDEQIPGYSSEMKKNRMATIGVKMGVTDFRFQNAMCKKMELASSAGQFSELSFDFLGFNQERGSFGTWTLPSGMIDSDSIVAHHQWRVEMGISENNLIPLAVTSFNLGLEIPLQVIQDTQSGLYLAEPIMEGKYGINSEITLSRYSSELFQNYRDAWSNVMTRISSTFGFYRQDFFINTAKISQAGPDDDNVAKEPLKLEIGYSDTNYWSNALYGNSLIHNSPLILRVRDKSSLNSMLGV